MIVLVIGVLLSVAMLVPDAEVRINVSLFCGYPIHTTNRTNLVSDSQAEGGLLGLERVLDVNALLNSGNGNKGDGVQDNQVKGNQKYWHNILNLERGKQE